MRMTTCAILVLFPASAVAGPLKVEAEDAADHHVSAQGKYRGGLPNSWEWKLGSRRSGKNITGITAHGLLAVHRLTGLDEHQKAALRAARSLIRAYDRGWNKRRPYSQDIEFLAAAGYIIDAGRWFGITTGRYPAHVYADMVIGARTRGRIPQVAGWDLSSAIRAAAAVGRTDYAKALLSETLRRRGEWDKPGVGQDLARGSLLWALAELRGRGVLTAAQSKLAQDLAVELAARQQKNGAWLERKGAKIYCTQTTAYAILGLSRWSTGKRAAARGRRWLTRSALTDKRFFQGGRIWATTYLRSGQPENNFNSEIQSEAMMALATEK
jgi:hypothetical protein